MLRRLGSIWPEVIGGPLQPDAQHWTDIGGSRREGPSRSRFVEVNRTTHVEISTKPFGVGMFTSTGAIGGRSMWRVYLDLERGSTLFPLPWRTWLLAIQEGGTVCEIAGAVDWVRFVSSHPLVRGSFVYPDWNAAASTYDAVHMTARAVVATQGLSFPVARWLIAPTHWDVESTLWLRWRFEAATAIETVE